jgi:hypothetical protein
MTYVQHLVASPADILPFLTATGERTWAEGWNPTVIHPTSGLEGEGHVFRTSSPSNPDTWWVCTEYSLPSGSNPGRITYARFTPGQNVTTVHITLEAEGPDRTLASVRYTWTGLTAKGNAWIAAQKQDEFDVDLKEWETALNKALARRK